MNEQNALQFVYYIAADHEKEKYNKKYRSPWEGSCLGYRLLKKCAAIAV